MTFADLISQINMDPASVMQFGFGGALLIVITRFLDRMMDRLEALEHTMKGLSKALWMDLSCRPDASGFVREEAKRMLDRMEAKESEVGKRPRK